MCTQLLPNSASASIVSGAGEHAPGDLECPSRRRCHKDKCRSFRAGGQPCGPDGCAAKAGLLVENPSIVAQRAFLTHRLHGRRSASCREGHCRSLKRRGLQCVPGQCVAKFGTVHSAARLHEYAEVHGYGDKKQTAFWELVALISAGEAPSLETLVERGEEASRLAQQQRQYAPSSKWSKRGARKKKQKQKKRQADLHSKEENANAARRRIRLTVQPDCSVLRPVPGLFEVAN